MPIDSAEPTRRTHVAPAASPSDIERAATKSAAVAWLVRKTRGLEVENILPIRNARSGLLRNVLKRLMNSLLRLLGGGPSTRLSADQVIALARESAPGELRHELSLASVIEENGRKLWIVSECAIGRFYVVVIDDASSAVVSQKYVGLR